VAVSDAASQEVVCSLGTKESMHLVKVKNETEKRSRGKRGAEEDSKTDPF